MTTHELTTWYEPKTDLTVLGWLDPNGDDDIPCFTFASARDASIARDVLRATKAQKPKPVDQVEHDRLVARTRKTLGWS